MFELRGSTEFQENPLGVVTDQLIKTSFSSRRYLHLLKSYTVLSKVVFSFVGL